ncbi:response regulator [Umezawaea endophytica]|uniref:Response regulator transcription factor n=1 Tax=Umezawaea endophytica TaxID=1654476 RepID=A0A9X2VJI0_9PSEU|nr:response regulator transcription factor [Umezawaea endophytica]MCS7477768.1 response regulator transcription factor [Umezawaea endophytica]
MTDTRHRVLIVDDHPIFVRGLRGELEDAEDVEVVGECATGEDAIAFTEREHPDVVLVDLRIPRFAGAEPTLCGPEVIRRIVELVPATRLLVLSMHEEPEHVRASLRAGAAGYLCKEETNVVQAVRTVAEGNKAVLDLGVITALLDQQVPDGDLPFRLTRAEYRMLVLMARGQSNQQIATELTLATKTVANRAGEIQSKLGARDRAEVVEKARKHGIGGGEHP